MHLDNVTAAAYLAKKEGTRSETLNALTKEILIFCRDHGITLSPADLPGIANLGADALSRGTETRGWFINPRVSERIFSRLGLPQIDLFASRRSAQVKTYFSLDRRDNHSTGTNALNQSWTFKHIYAFPLPQIIPLILGRMRECKGTLILVTPFWSRAAWLPELLQMAVRAPFRLPQHPSTVRDLSTGRPLPSLQKLKLTVWLTCGKHSESRGQIVSWQNSSIPRTTPTIGQFLKFLWFLYEDRHMAWSTIRVHRAAVATIIDPLTNSPLSQHPMVCRFMKTVFLARPPPRKVKPNWSVSTVLEKLRSWGNPEELSRQKLTWRVAMLLALASARRASDLSLLHIDEDHLFKTNDFTWCSVRSRIGRR